MGVLREAASRYPRGASVSVLVGLLARNGPWAISEGSLTMREGSWIWLMARCWWPSWIQRALQLLQMAIGYRPKVMVTRADRHSGQRGMRTSRTGSGAGCRRC